jgi:hypothetical protein
MAAKPPSDEALSEYYLNSDVDITIGNEGAPKGSPSYSSANGTIIDVKVDGDDGVYLSIDVLLPLEEIPELDRGNSSSASPDALE